MGLGARDGVDAAADIAMADVPARDAGVASALVNVSLYISGALGLAALGAIATDRTQTLTARATAPTTPCRRLPAGVRGRLGLRAGAWPWRWWCCARAAGASGGVSGELVPNVGPTPS